MVYYHTSCIMVYPHASWYITNGILNGMMMVPCILVYHHAWYTIMHHASWYITNGITNGMMMLSCILVSRMVSWMVWWWYHASWYITNGILNGMMMVPCIMVYHNAILNGILSYIMHHGILSCIMVYHHASVLRVATLTHHSWGNNSQVIHPHRVAVWHDNG
jgi:hypothetical protein